MRIKRFPQEPSHCVTSTVSSIANFYNSKIDYNKTKDVANNFIGPTKDGFDDGETGRLLNKLGFKKIDIVTTELLMFDYNWAKLSKRKLIEVMDESRNKINEDYRETFKSLIRFLKNKGCRNNIIIDYDFSKYIKKYLDKSIPIIVTFNWTMFFKWPKENIWRKTSPVMGDVTLHAAVIYKYDDEGVHICDSHQEYYKYRLKGFKKGRYKVPWEKLMVTMASGSLVIPQEYNEEICKKTIREMD
jgi:hypothetical protein